MGRLRRLGTSWLIAATVIGVALGRPGGARRARADGAFPDAQGLLLASDRPDEIMLATNFGVVISEDGGQTWSYSCERTSNGATASFYQVGAAPRDRLFAITNLALITSDDRACGWGMAQGMLAGKPPLDFFPDAANANRVWAVRGPDAPATDPYTVVESTDGGTTFTTVRFTAAAGDAISGVELARSDANVAYVTLRGGSTFIPRLAVTRDGGATWNTRDLTAQLGNATVRIVSVDPTDPGKLFLRVSVSAGASSTDGIALSLDGGATFVAPSPITVVGGALTSFVRMPSGTLLAGGVDVLRHVIFRSTNGGTTFTEIDSPTVKGLGQRDGRLFIASNNDSAADGYALGESSDEGTTWHPLMRFDQIQAIEGCAQAACLDDCTLKANLGTWGDETCTAGGLPPDAGDAGAGGSGEAGADSGTPVLSASGGCHCATAGGAVARGRAGGVDVTAGIALSLVVLVSARRRRRARRAAPVVARP